MLNRVFRQIAAGIFQSPEYEWANDPCPIHLHEHIKMLMDHLKFRWPCAILKKKDGPKKPLYPPYSKMNIRFEQRMYGTITHSFHKMVRAHPRNIPVTVYGITIFFKIFFCLFSGSMLFSMLIFDQPVPQPQELHQQTSTDIPSTYRILG